MATIVITGSSSGIGKATAKYFAEQGWTVAATMRSPEKENDLTSLSNVSLHALDVSRKDSVQTALSEILETCGAVDVVLNNAGYALMGPFEAATSEEIESQFATNVFGLMNVTRAFLPHFRSRGEGMFLNVSSIGGLITFPLMSLYHSSKWAVEGFSESLSHEMQQLGIKVKLIEPGGVATDFGGRSMSRGSIEHEAYEETAAKFRKNIGELGIERSTAQFIAEGIYAAATDGSDRLRYVIGPDAERTWARRREAGAESFVAEMRARLFEA